MKVKVKVQPSGSIEVTRDGTLLVDVQASASKEAASGELKVGLAITKLGGGVVVTIPATEWELEIEVPEEFEDIVGSCPTA